MDSKTVDVLKTEAEIAKLMAETTKLHAETVKLNAEGRKLHRDALVAPILAIAAFAGGAVAVGQFLQRLPH
jgi:cell division protein FtsB